MKTFRKERLSSLIQLELNKVISRELEFDKTLVTITEVEVSPDLETATVWISALPEDGAGNALTDLNQERNKLQGMLLRKLKMRRVPKINFKLDTGAKHAAVIEKTLLNDYNEEQ